jgi:hypothetical protein
LLSFSFVALKLRALLYRALLTPRPYLVRLYDDNSTIQYMCKFIVGWRKLRVPFSVENVAHLENVDSLCQSSSFRESKGVRNRQESAILQAEKHRVGAAPLDG